MTISQVLTTLSSRLLDVGGSEFSDQNKIDAFNLGQLMLCNLISRDHLSELEVSKTLTLSNLSTDNRGRKYFDLSTNLIYPILNGITELITTHTGAYNVQWELLSAENIRKVENSEYMTKTYKEGTAVLFNNKIYFFGSTATINELFAINIKYLEDPIITSTLGHVAHNVKLNPSIISIALDLAESILWSMDKKIDRALNAQTKAFNLIGSLNA